MIRRWCDAALAALFLVVISLPLGLVFAGHPSTVEGENRTAASLPALPREAEDVWRFPARFEAWFNDHFGGRATFIRWHARALVQWLGTSPPADRGFAESGLAEGMLGNLSSKVLLGRDGWLFLSGGLRLESYRRAQPFSAEALDALVARYEARRAWLAERGIAYLVTVAPDKHTIYPEFMPASIPRGARESQLDQLAGGLASGSTVDFLDLRPSLLAAKRQRPVYARTDTHWNAFGAWVAYREIVRRLAPRFPGLEPWPLDAFQIVDADGPGGDLAKHLGLPDLLRERHVRLRPQRPRRATVVVEHPRKECPGVVWRVTETPDTTLPAVVFFHDSFLEPVWPLLSEHFRHASYHLYRPFDRAIVEREHPDVVVEEIVERMLIAAVRKGDVDVELADP